MIHYLLLFFSCYRMRYPHDTRLLLSTCTNVPMFFSCESLKTYSRRLNALKTFRYRRKRKYTPSPDISSRSIRDFNWTRKYNLSFQGIYRMLTIHFIFPLYYIDVLILKYFNVNIYCYRNGMVNI